MRALPGRTNHSHEVRAYLNPSQRPIRPGGATGWIQKEHLPSAYLTGYGSLNQPIDLEYQPMEVDPLYLAVFIGVLFISTGLMKSRAPMMILTLYIVVASTLEVLGGYGRPMGGFALLAEKKIAERWPALGKP